MYIYLYISIGKRKYFLDKAEAGALEEDPSARPFPRSWNFYSFTLIL